MLVAEDPQYKKVFHNYAFDRHMRASQLFWWLSAWHVVAANHGEQSYEDERQTEVEA